MINKHLRIAPHNVWKLLLICYIAYVATFFGRTNYSSAMVAIIPDLGCTKAEAGLVNSFFWGIYGIGQIVNGLFADRINNKVMITLSLSVSAVINLSMPFVADIHIMKYLWLLNGIAQSVMLTNLMGTITHMAPIDMIPRVTAVFHTSAAAGTLLSYLTSSLFLKIASWKFLFYAASALLLVTAIVWFWVISNLQKHRIHTDDTETEPAPQTNFISSLKQIKYIFIAGGLVFSLVIAFFDAVHREGLTVWLPNFAKETYFTSDSISVLIAIVLPIVNLFGSWLVSFTGKRLGKYSNSVVIATTLYIAAFFVLIALRLTAFHSLVAACILIASITLMMTAINACVVNHIAIEVAAYGCSAALTGIINFGYCSGSSLSSYLIGFIQEKWGWVTVFDFFWVVAIIAVVCGIACSFFWTRFLRRLKISQEQNNTASHTA
ncbi:MAG: MFS transporter [Oscillospiraceae bacterium]|nr:MFS transporter [Oscillospiraceae bacterium]